MMLVTVLLDCTVLTFAMSPVVLRYCLTVSELLEVLWTMVLSTGLYCTDVRYVTCSVTVLSYCFRAVRSAMDHGP
jgi:hypothetical protein